MPENGTRIDIAQDVQEIQPGARVIGLSTGPVQGGVTVTTNSEGGASSWLAWGQHVLAELVREDKHIVRLEEQIHDLERRMVDDSELQQCSDDVEGLRNRIEGLRAEFIEMRAKVLLIAAGVGAVVGIVADVVIRRMLGG